MKLMGKGLIVFFLLAGMVFPFAEYGVSAAEQQNAVLVLYSSEDGTVDAEQRLLDMAVSAFAKKIEFKNVHDVKPEDTDGITHLFYYGKTKDALSDEVKDIIDSFEGPVTAIAENVVQLGDSFRFVQPGHCKNVIRLSMPDHPGKSMTTEPLDVNTMELDKGTETLVEGKMATEETVIPVFVKNGNRYYYAVDSLVFPFSIYFSQVLYEVFDKEPPQQTPAFIRLEDIHPQADPEQLMAAAEYLKEQNIPYMMAVIPEYTDPQTGEELHLNDVPEVLEALRYMQNNGGSIILHGYTHQFRDTETGEGFEFWDAKHDVPIYHGPDEEPDLRTEEDFESPEAYEAFMKDNKAFEREYIEKKLTRGIQELANFGLYPLAFEAPHYTMSQNGYKVVSKYFSTYVGQLQLHDKDWRTMETTPLPSRPGFLHGMKLYPETLGYVHSKDKDAVAQMMSTAKQYRILDGGVNGGFYHPYLGVERLKDLIKEMKKIPNVHWIDLKEENNVTKADNVVISSSKGEIHTDINQRGLMMTSMDFPAYHLKVLAQKSIWGIAGIGMSAVVAFGVYATLQRPRLRSREEKNTNG